MPPYLTAMLDSNSPTTLAHAVPWEFSLRGGVTAHVSPSLMQGLHKQPHSSLSLQENNGPTKIGERYRQSRRAFRKSSDVIITCGYFRSVGEEHPCFTWRSIAQLLHRLKFGLDLRPASKVRLLGHLATNQERSFRCAPGDGLVRGFGFRDVLGSGFRV